MGFDTLEIPSTYNQNGEAPWPLPAVEPGGRPAEPDPVGSILSAPRGEGLRRGLASVAAPSPRIRVALLLVCHALIFSGVYMAAYAVRFDGVIPPLYLGQALATLPWVVALKLAIFLATGSYRGWWRYVTFADMIVLAETASLGTVALMVASVLPRDLPTTPRSVVMLDWGGTLLVLGGLRGMTRLFRERYYPLLSARNATRALVAGTTEANLAIARDIQGRPQLNIKVVGFLDDDAAMHGRSLAGVRVLGALEDLGRQAVLHRAETVLIPVPAVSPKVVRDIVAACGEVDIKAQVVPGIDGFITGSIAVRPRDVGIEDLLPRDPIRLDEEPIARFLRGRTVMVTGAAGSIGSEVCRQVLGFQPARLLLLDNSENGLFYLERELREQPGGAAVVSRVASITDALRLRAVFAQDRPTLVFHAAAYKHVPMMEANPGEAVKTNVLGTRTLVDEAIRAGVEAFVMISSDKAVNPSSIMGACKRLAETYVQSRADGSKTRLVAVRFGNVLGSNGSVVPIFKEQIRQGGPVTVTHPEMTRYFMTIPEASRLVLQAGALGRGGEIFVLRMGSPVKIVDLARQIIRLSGMIEGRDIEIAFTGMRPGEKLHEELYTSGEEHVSTSHPKIMAVKPREAPCRSIGDGLDRISRLVDQPSEQLIAALKDLVPEFRGHTP